MNDGALEDFMGRKAAGTLCDYRNVAFNYENCSITGENRVIHYKTNYTAQISIDTGTMHYPETIEVLMDGNALTSGTDYTYNNENGTITINSNKITEDITISAIATRYAYRVKYVRNTPIPSYFNETVNIELGTYTLRTPVYTSVYIPEGKEFKCWLVDSEEVGSGETITLTDDVIVTPLFKEIEAVEELDYRETVSSLS